MVICINAGGVGSRLWPLSTESNPKQVLKLQNSKTLIENIYNLAKKITNEVFIVTNNTQHSKILKLTKIENKKLIVEPERKGTLYSTLYALGYINNFYDCKKMDEQICFIHADHVYNDNSIFIKDIKNMCMAAAKYDNVFIACTTPELPSTKFGYIKYFKWKNKILRAIEFIEKPRIQMVRKMLESKKYVINEGIFVCSFNSLLKAISNNQSLLKIFKLINENIKDVKNLYSKVTNECIEKGLYYKIKKLLIYQIHFKWTDIGTYSSLYEISQKDPNNNVIIGSGVKVVNCHNNLIINKRRENVVIIGKNNCLIINTSGGLLVVDKKNEDMIKEAIRRVDK